MKKFILLSLLSVAIACNKENNPITPPDEGWPQDSIRVIKTGLTLPWELVWGKDDYLWVTERFGQISRIDPRSGNTQFSFTIDEVLSIGEGGLLGMVQHPNFKTNGFLYVVYNYQTSTGTYLEKVVRYTYANNTLGQALTLIQGIPAGNIHNGSRLWITEDEKLLITTGDAGVPANAQNRSSLAGKVLRINLDGSIPSDNPIPGSPVWSLGHRNPQGLVVIKGNIFTTEHGPNIEDELNLIVKGANYGWPNVNGPCDGSEISFCTANNIIQPIWSSGGSTIATAGIDYYNHSRIADWGNSILMTTLKDQTLYQIKLNDNATGASFIKPFFKNRWGRLRDVCVSPEGRVYICTSNGSGGDVIVEIQKL